MSTGDDKWLRAMLQSAPAEETAACLDAERLAAWTDGALGDAERAEVELHLSSCGHCMAAVAALQRTAPPVTPAEPLFAPSRLLRWLVPLTAAATAVAIWVAVPGSQRPVQEPPSATRAVVPETAPGRQPGAAEPAPLQPESQQSARQQAVPESQPRESRDAYAPVPDVGNQALERPSAREDSSQLRDERRRSVETDQAKAESSELSARARAEAPAAPPPAAAASEVDPRGAAASSADTGFRSAAKTAFAPASVSPADPSALWRVASAGASIERSTDGGQTWAPTPRVPGVSPGSPAVTMKAVRAVDARRAVVTTSDGRQFYTTDNGSSWTLLQENQTAPF